ncbi:DUF742 domain-containing protein [Saccharopolyspora phatthalungensis]|uniref:DUF742 domain-containing protein n=1 Tax=Saccharopolyspora phatthalungensis TaxID=664693 RepID=A0A840QID0_9PSEU|nr:DUF742 domain-containing protein [Saccharopolyspora phatthalungensis]MBB5160007.1 hypothetical protein [Saccharopolyspora phatthalungensis]
MSSHRRDSRAEFHPLSFGGWRDYQEWADNEFRPRPAPPSSDETAEEPDEEARLTDDRAADPTQEAEDPAEPGQPGDTDSADGENDAAEPDSVELLRPYVRTGGRARPEYELLVETLLSSAQLPEAPDRPHSPMNVDLQRIHALCAAPQSVAEISAHLGVPLTVARILISDAINAGLVVVHEGRLTRGSQPSLELLRQVHEGLRKLA